MGLIGKLLSGQTKVQFIQNDNTVIQFDATMKENHKRDSPPTEFPVEDGTSISDHIILKPFSLDLTAIITDSPIGDIEGLLKEVATSVATALLPPVGVIGATAGIALFNSLTGAKRRSVANYEQILQLQENRKAFDVLTSLKRYPNMFISSLSAPRDLESGQAIVFTISLVQLIIVSPQSVNVQVFANPGLASNLAHEGEKSAGIPNGFEQGYKDTTAKFNRISGGKS